MLQIDLTTYEILNTNTVWDNAGVEGATPPAHLVNVTGPIPEVGEGQALVLNGTKVTVVTDLRGQVYYDAQGNEYTITSLNERPQRGWTKTRPLVLLRQEKKQTIRAAFTAALAEPVTVNGVDYHGDYESAIKLDAARRLAEQTRQPRVTFFDTANAAHELTIEDAKAVVATIGERYQTLFARKQRLMRDIDAANTKAALNRIGWAS